MKDPIDPAGCAELLSALAAPQRIMIIRFLRDGERNVTEVAEHLGTEPVNVAHHMGILRHAGIVQNRKQGRFVYYALTPGFLQCETSSAEMEFYNLGCCRLEMPRGEDLPT